MVIEKLPPHDMDAEEALTMYGQMKLFEFSNSHLESLYESPTLVVFLAHGNQVLRAIIISNAIQVMNDIIIRQVPFMCLLPTQDMFGNIESPSPYTLGIFGSWMFGCINHNVPRLALITTTLPIHLPSLSINITTVVAKFSLGSFGFTTIEANTRSFSCLSSACPTPLCSCYARLPAVVANTSIFAFMFNLNLMLLTAMWAKPCCSLIRYEYITTVYASFLPTHFDRLSISYIISYYRGRMQV